ncbi:MAG: ABC transporter permease [Flavobacteriales bacterium]|nr:ABC transporter permease [Flavobacteriales bacterium]
MPKVFTYFAWIWLSLVIFTAITAPILCNDKPWIVKYEDKILFPAFSIDDAQKIITNENSSTAWKKQTFEFAIWPLCTYFPGTTDWENIAVSPFDKQNFKTNNNRNTNMPFKFRHWLGTNHKGEDVLAAIIYGCRNSLSIGVFSMILAGFIGVFLGIIAGFYQNQGMLISNAALAGLILGIFPALFYGFIRPSILITEDLAYGLNNLPISLIAGLSLFVSILGLFILIVNRIGKYIPCLNKKVAIPLDAIINRLTEWMNTIPKLFLILILAGIFNKTATGLILILGLIQWTGIARIVRAETLSLRQSNWIESAISLGISEFRIIVRHLFPHIIPSFMVVFILGIASSIMAESALSFLGAGVPDDWISWGTLAADGKSHIEYWWLLAMPGIFLFFTLLSLSYLSDYYRHK